MYVHDTAPRLSRSSSLCSHVTHLSACSALTPPQTAVLPWHLWFPAQADQLASLAPPQKTNINIHHSKSLSLGARVALQIHPATFKLPCPVPAWPGLGKGRPRPNNIPHPRHGPSLGGAAGIIVTAAAQVQEHANLGPHKPRPSTLEAFKGPRLGCARQEQQQQQSSTCHGVWPGSTCSVTFCLSGAHGCSGQLSTTCAPQRAADACQDPNPNPSPL
jgi:hypothetical protein